MRRSTWLAILWTLAILVLCWTPKKSLPGDESEPSIFRRIHGDKIIHCGLFVVFTVLWRRASDPRSIPIIAVSGVALAIITELGQATSIVGRDADVWDGLADSLGVLIGLAVAPILARRTAPPLRDGVG